MKKNIKLSEWAELNSYTYRGAYNLYKKGQIPGARQTNSGAILVSVGDQSGILEKEQEGFVERFIEHILLFCAKLYNSEMSKDKISKITRILKND